MSSIAEIEIRDLTARLRRLQDELRAYPWASPDARAESFAFSDEIDLTVFGYQEDYPGAFKEETDHLNTLPVHWPMPMARTHEKSD